jgi:MFS family permease
MPDPTMDGYIISALVFAGAVYSIYLAGRIAERRGRSFKTWASIAAILGPLALPLLLLLPKLQHGEPAGPNGEKRPCGPEKPVLPGNADPGQLNLSFV